MLINYQIFSLQYDLDLPYLFSPLTPIVVTETFLIIDSWYKSCAVLQTPTAKINWIYTPWPNTRSPSVCSGRTCASRWGITRVLVRTWTDDGPVGIWLCPERATCYRGLVVTCPAHEDSGWGECCDSGKYEPRERSEACWIIEVALLGWDNAGRKGRFPQGKRGSFTELILFTWKDSWT